MPMRGMQSAFHEEADLEQTCGEVTEELKAYFAADADHAEAFRKVLLEAKCPSVKQLKNVSLPSLSAMVHKANMGDGTMGILIGTLKQPYVWITYHDQISYHYICHNHHNAHTHTHTPQPQCSSRTRCLSKQQKSLMRRRRQKRRQHMRREWHRPR